ncbi:MAG: hypothetical protein M3141_10485, partial [Actinomycetota bacterium]|nr:hypothetical protein [Actinomycetota bacterium]
MNLAGAIYGTVVVTALVTALSEDESVSPGELAISITATMLAFWLAHAYANLLAGEATDRRLPGRRDVRAALAREFTIVEPVGVPVAFLMLGELGLVSAETSEDLAIAGGLAVLGLAGWGLARHDRLSPGRA